MSQSALVRSLSVLACTFLLCVAQPAEAADPPTSGLRYPSLTPDGKTVVFCYRGDIWKAPVDGKGQPMRLTIHEEQDTLCRVSPDGTRVAFSSKRNGGYDIYVTSIEGGMPEAVTFHSATEIMCDWSPDGKKILFMSNRAGGMSLDLFELDLAAGGTPRRITFDGGRDGTYSADGKHIVYSRGTISIYWDNYEGSANYDLYTIPTAGGTPKRITKTDGNERYPSFSKDGKTLYFVAEEKGVANYYSMPLAGGTRTKVTNYPKYDIHRPDVTWDYHTVVFEIAGLLYWTDLAKPTPKPTPIALSVKSDVRSSGLERRTVTNGGEQVHISHDGTTAVFSLRGDIWMMPANGGTGQRIIDGPGHEEWPRFSPDGTKIAFFTDRGGNKDIFVYDLRTRQTRQVTRHPAGDFYHSWSPDGTELVFCSERSGNRDIWKIEIATGKTTQLTNHPSADDDPCFSPDGKKVAFDSGRSGTQAIYVMNADGSGKRRVAQVAGFLQVPSWSPDGRFLVYEAASPTGGSGGIFVIASSGGQSMQISRDGSTACWSRKGDYIYFTADRGPHGSGVFRVPAPKSIIAGERVPFIGNVQIDRRKELEAVFDEAWNAMRSGFYDRKMHGVNWNEMKKKYRPMAIDAENKDEFHNIIRQMLAELGASHLGIFGGTRSVDPARPVPETGYLGLEFEQEPTDTGARKISKVVSGGPADRAGLRDGDVVERIGKYKLKANTNLDKVLAGTAGKPLPLRYRPFSKAGLGVERTLTMTPINYGQLNQLFYNEWIATCARRVKEATAKSGEVGYIHLNAMNPENLARFQQTVQRWNATSKIKGMILDVRNNGGGNIHQQLMQILVNRPLARVQMRNGRKMVQPALYWDRPVVVLINERSFSDAEVFPFMFRAGNCGKIIGVPTAGGVIGTNNITLSDGSQFRIPRTGFFSLTGTNLEGLGVKPDILVEETPEDRLEGRDPQLAKAIEVVGAEIAAAAKAKEEAPKPKPESKKTDNTPGPQPAPEPVQPAAAASAGNPLADAIVGEWVNYRLVSPDGAETILKITVERVANGAVQFKKEIVKGPPAMPPLPDKIRQLKVAEVLPAFGEVVGMVTLNMKVQDAEAEVLQARLKQADGTELRLSFTNVVPAYGILRVEMGKRLIMEAVEWGVPATAAPAAPVEKTPAAEPKPAAPAETKPAPADGTAANKAAHPHPLRDAKQGEWARYRQATGRGTDIEVLEKIIEVDDEDVVIERTMSIGDQTRPMRPSRQKRLEEIEPPAGADVAWSKDKVTVGETELDCIVMTLTRGGREQKIWFCDAVPVMGMVKVEIDGVVIRELIEWGKDGE